MEKRKGQARSGERYLNVEENRMDETRKFAAGIENGGDGICFEDDELLCETKKVQGVRSENESEEKTGHVFDSKMNVSRKSRVAQKRIRNDRMSDISERQGTCYDNGRSRSSNSIRLRFKKKQSSGSVSAEKNSDSSVSSSKKNEKGRGRISSSKRMQEHEGNVIKFRCDFPSTQAKVMLARGWKQVDPEDPSWDLWWCETSDVRQVLDAKLESHQKIPHFRNHYELTRKNYLCRNLKRYKKLLLKSGKTAEAALCDSMPITFELPNDYKMFVEEYQKQQGATWIVKPVGRSQGKGIFLFRRLKDLAEWRAKEQNNNSAEHAETPPATFVVQKYVDDPYLLAGRKFDLRLYVLVTSFHPLKVWLAREGFARLSGKQFDLKNIDDSRVHLTNMAIQLRTVGKDAEGFTREEKVKQGCKWALFKLMQYLAKSHGIAVVRNLLRRIAGVIMASVLAVQPAIMQGKNSFELYGYDILLDENLTPWLLEVNASPALTGTDSDDYRLKFNLIDDALNILDFEARFSGREIRIGGFDLLWDDGPVWAAYPTCSEPEPETDQRRLNIFLGAKNDRERQLRRLREVLSGRRRKS